MTTAQQIVESGIARATTNDAGKLSNDGELLGRLGRVFPGLYTLAARQRPEEFTATSNLTLAGNPATATLASGTLVLTDVIEIRLVRGVSGTVAAGTKIHIVPETEAYRTFQISPTVFRRGLSIFSRAQAGDPVATDVIQLLVLDSPAVLTALTTVLDGRYPLRHMEMLTNDIALYLSAKDAGRNAAQFQELQADQKMRIAIFAQEYSLKASAIEQIFSDSVPALATG